MNPLPILPTYQRGRVRPPNLDHLKELSAERHGHKLRALPPATEAGYDSRTLGLIPPVVDQKQCGSCWDESGTGVVEVALILAGFFKADGSDALSPQYTLDCGRNGGCGGDDNTTVLDWAKKTGLPREADYGPYTAGAGRCKYTAGMKLWKIDDWGFVDGTAGYDKVSDTQLTKNAIKQFGCVGCAVAAGSSWDGYQSGTVHTGGSTGIDHDVILVGWQDTSTSITAYLAADTVGTTVHGWWWMRNSWSAQWGEDGYMRIAYGADSIGTEAVWAVVKGVGPVPTPIDWFA